MNTVNPKLAEIALEHVSGNSFEKFFHAFYPSISGAEFVPAGGTKDGGLDAFLDRGVWQGQNSKTYYQASVQEDHRSKIRHTMRRLRESGRDPKTLVYVTSRPIRSVDQEEELLTTELDAYIKIRNRDWIAAHINDTPQTVAAFETYLLPSAAFLKKIGGASLLAASRNIPRAVCVFLSQEVERRRSKSDLLASITDSLILWALEGTDPDKGIFMTRDAILSKIEETLPTAKHFVRGVLDHRLEVLSSKSNPTGREIRWHKKAQNYCLTYETRQLVAEENIQDEYLKTRVLEIFEIHAQSILGDQLEILSPKGIANIALAAIELTFEKEGLELARFLTGDDSGDIYLSVSDQVDEAMQRLGLKGETALITKDCALGIIRRSFYDSSSEERTYFQKLSRTYTLLFSIQAEPRIVEYFKSMSSDFILYVGTDILIQALSERYLRPEDQRACNMLQLLRDAGSTLILAEPVLEEVWSHMEATDYEYRNYFRRVEQHVDRNVARHASKILIRAYFYGKLHPLAGIKPPVSWEAFIEQMCSYADLHRDAGKQQIQQYLVDRFRMEFETNRELSALSDEGAVGELAAKLEPVKKEQVLATNDARLILSIYGKRAVLEEGKRANPYGYQTWWLTQETRVRQMTGELVAKMGALYVIRPEFILNFIALSPTTADVRRTYENVFPSILGVRLSNRMREDVFHSVMKSAGEVGQVDDARAKVMMSELSNKLKGDFFKRYETQLSGGPLERGSEFT
jgi:hypothetical protein